MRIIAILLLVAIGFTAVSCSTMSPQDFDGKTPRFVPEEFFLGLSKGQGYFFDRFGSVKSGFKVDLKGSWDGKILTLDELLTYDTGDTLKRIYQIKKISDHNYEVTTDDIVGTGTIESYGNALKWTYSLKQKIGEDIWVLHFDDWMYLKEDGLVLNRAYAKKFGIGLGEVFMSLQKTTPQE